MSTLSAPVVGFGEIFTFEIILWYFRRRVKA
jgi:hypothetical protein